MLALLDRLVLPRPAVPGGVAQRVRVVNAAAIMTLVEGHSTLIRLVKTIVINGSTAGSEALVNLVQADRLLEIDVLEVMYSIWDNPQSLFHRHVFVENSVMSTAQVLYVTVLWKAVQLTLPLNTIFSIDPAVELVKKTFTLCPLFCFSGVVAFSLKIDFAILVPATHWLEPTDVVLLETSVDTGHKAGERPLRAAIWTVLLLLITVVSAVHHTVASDYLVPELTEFALTIPADEQVTVNLPSIDRFV